MTRWQPHRSAGGNASRPTNKSGKCAEAQKGRPILVPPDTPADSEVSSKKAPAPNSCSHTVSSGGRTARAIDACQVGGIARPLDSGCSPEIIAGGGPVTILLNSPVPKQSIHDVISSMARGPFDRQSGGRQSSLSIGPLGDRLPRNCEPTLIASGACQRVLGRSPVLRLSNPTCE